MCIQIHVSRSGRQRNATFLPRNIQCKEGKEAPDTHDVVESARHEPRQCAIRLGKTRVDASVEDAPNRAHDD